MKKEQRNLEIMQYVTQGMSYAEIGELYNISATRVRQLHANGIREKLREKNEIWHFLEKANCPGYKKTRIYNTLHRHGIFTLKDLRENVENLMCYDGLGAKNIQIILDLLREEED